MKIKAVSGIMLTLLLVSMLTLAFNVRSVVAQSSLLVDQSQTLYNVWAMTYNNGHAQSFVPSHNILSRVDVLLQLSSGVLDYVKFKIFRDDGTGFPDTSVVLATAELVPGPDVVWDGFEYTGWYIADFADIEVTVGQRYYIWVDITYGSPEWKGKWGVADGHGDPAYYDLYPEGEAWNSICILPTPSKDLANDFTFKTYYYETITRTWTVDDDGPADFHTIQSAINAASPGDTIYVKAGIYYEHVTIGKSLNLMGENRETTIIDGSGTGKVVLITANNVTVDGFTIQNSGSNYPEDNGIYVYSSNYNNITKNIITNNLFGIRLVYSSHNTLVGNNVSENDDGIWLYSSNYNNLIDNAANWNRYHGITLYWYSDFNNVKENNASNNSWGITVSLSSNNNLTKNVANWNTGWGIDVEYSYSTGNQLVGNTVSNNNLGLQLYESSGNILHHNNLVNNSYQVWCYTSINTWDDGYPSGGNYWSNYNGTDLSSGPYQNETGSDGIGDDPYVIDAENQDNYPLMNPWIDRTVGVKAGDWAEYEFEFTWSSTDPNEQPPPEIVDVITNLEWYRIEVLDVSGTAIEFQQIGHFKNGTETKYTWIVDVSTGLGNGTYQLAFISADLSAGYRLYAPYPGQPLWCGWLIKETIPRTYVNEVRETNHLNVTDWSFFGRHPPSESESIDDFYWDRATGIISEQLHQQNHKREGYVTSFSLLMKIVDTNLWGAPPTVVSVYPPTSTAVVGETFAINITVASITDEESLYGWECRLTFDPNIVNAVNATEGPFLKTPGYKTTWLGPLINNTEGTILVGALLTPPFPPKGAVGNGTLATVTFKAIAQGTTALEFKEKRDTKLYTVKGEPPHQLAFPIEHTAEDGFFDNRALTAALDVDPNALNLHSIGKWITAYIELPEGYNVSDIDIYSIRLNDRFPVSLLPKPPVPVPTEIGDYDSDGVPDLMVKFNRTALTSHIYHTLGIENGNVTLTITGNLTDGTPLEGSDAIWVMFAGDICGMYEGAILPIPNGVVDLDDFMIIAMPGHIFARNPTGDPVWGPACDLNKDDKVGVADLMMVGINCGATVPPQP